MAKHLDVGDSPVKFSVSNESINGIVENGVDEKPQEPIPKSRSSRFKVAKVEFAEEPRNEDQHLVNGHGEPEDDHGDKPVNNIHEAGKLPEKAPSSSIDSTSPPYSPATGDSYQTTYDGNTNTMNLKTFGANTVEKLPHLDHYRNLMSATGAMRKRPTLLELHEHDQHDEGENLLGPDVENGHVVIATSQIPVEEVKAAPTAPKFGWITGVLVRCLLNIYGVMLFLRLSFVVGQAGIGLSGVVILLATVVTTITALSMAAICTNGDVKGGGAYYMISRSLGPEFGGAIGLIFSVANAVAVAMYVVGFAETIRDILVDYDCLMVDELNDVRIIGAITIVVLLGIALIGMEWEARAQIVLLAILVVAIINFVIGTFIPPTPAKQARGFVGYRGDVFADNMGPDFRDGHNFFSIFSIFFPAATGILAGANISGDLKDAQKAIPKGTILAIIISSLTYICMAWMAGSCMLRDAVGPIIIGYNVTNGSMIETAAPIYSSESMNGSEINGGYCVAGNCSFGLQNDMQVMQLLSGYGPLTIAGIISATLSSALASLVSAPKVFQAVCRDKIFPFIHVFAKGYGPGEEPRRAYILAFFIGLACIFIGDLNAIAPLISNFFLMSYTLINYSCFDASLSKSPGWRPAFRYYSMWLSLSGAVVCLGVMFVINWWSALITLAFVSALYIYVHYKKPDINWGSSTQAHVYRNALQHTLKLSSVLDHVKNFRPQLLVLSGFPSHRQILVDFASNITKNISLMVCGNVIQGDPSEKLKDVRATSMKAYQWLYKRKTKAFYCGVIAPNLRSGCQSLLQCVGTGKLRPNTLLTGFKSNWREAKPSDVDDYFNVINDTFDMGFAVGVLRLQGGLDFSHVTEAAATMDSPRSRSPYFTSQNTPISEKPTNYRWSPFGTSLQVPQPERQNSKPQINNNNPSKEAIVIPPDDDKLSEEGDTNINIRLGGDMSDEEEEDSKVESEEAGPLNEPCVKGDCADINKDILKDLNRYHRKQKRGTIDVWWLFDDGGLTLLIPYLLSTKSYWEHCKLRVFMAGTKKMELDREQRQMANLLSKFRIEYSSMMVIADINKKPHKQNQEDFQNLVKDWVLNKEEGETEETHPWKISEEGLQAQKEKTNRHIRLRELLMQHSRDATLIVMTLPIPRKGLCTAGLYMSWLDTITKDMPPILLLRGNQDSVLTYYS